MFLFIEGTHGKWIYDFLLFPCNMKKKNQQTRVRDDQSRRLLSPQKGNTCFAFWRIRESLNMWSNMTACPYFLCIQSMGYGPLQWDLPNKDRQTDELQNTGISSAQTPKGDGVVPPKDQPKHGAHFHLV